MGREIESSIYECRVIHSRMALHKTSFSYRIFTFLLDLDEIDDLDKNKRFFSRNRFNFFSFYDEDHLRWGDNSPKKNLKSSILSYLEDQGCKKDIGKIYLLTNLRVLGYTFNPVSFYFVFDREGNPLTAIAEVGNTFGERKPFYFGTPERPNSTEFYFRLETKKEFYVSPFIPLDSKFDFKLQLPGDSLRIQVDSWEEGKKVLGTAYLGEKKSLSSKNLLFYFLKYPLVTVKIIGAIHYRAIILFIKKLPYLKKDDGLEKQIGVQIGKAHR